jgi:hypothetical protein
MRALSVSQVFSVDLTDEAIQEVMKNHIAVTLDTFKYEYRRPDYDYA